jgi:radical SAM superfamily enzyme YgiQ (UPF0313 family)
MNNKTALVICPPFWHKLPPLGLAFLEATLLSRDVETVIFDGNIELYHQSPAEIKKQWLSVRPAEAGPVREYVRGQQVWREQFVRQLAACQAAWYGFSLFNTNRECTLDMVRALRAARPDARIVVGGPQTLYEYHDKEAVPAIFNEPSIDHLVVGDGEQALLALVTGQTRARVLAFQETADLDEVPYPLYRGFNLKNYTRPRSLPLLFSRGCLRRCAFCAECLLAKRFRMRSSAHMAEEVVYHVNRHEACNFVFHDSLINGDLDKLDGFCNLMAELKLNIKWEAQLMVRADMPQQLFEKMKAAGCYNLFIGLESGSDHVLELMNKGFTLKEAVSTLRKIKAAGLHCEVSLITGFPGETEPDFAQTLNFLQEHQDLIPKIGQVNCVQHLPGTGLDGRQPESKTNDRAPQLVAFLQQHKFIMTEEFIGNLHHV